MAFQRSSRFKRMLFGLLALIFGGGTGLWGWTDPDAPVIGAIVQKLRNLAPADPSAPSPVLAIGSQRDPFTIPGAFEVAIAKVTIDPAELREGHHVDVQVKVSKQSPTGQVQLIWDSRYAGDRISLVGRQPIVASWADRPFQVIWQPGEEFVVEVWDRRAFFDKVIFLLTTTNGDCEFPLRPGAATFAFLGNGRRTANPPANNMQIQARRIGDSH